eukprot:g14752.t1
MMHPGVHSLALGLCLCVLYGGYETARASSLSLFNSTDASGASTAGLSFVLSLASLQLYGRGTELLGSRWTLMLSAGGCCAIFLGFALVSFEVDVPLQVVAMLFAVRETYVALIGTQVWGMLSSSLKERGSRESRRWFCIIQGGSCICSAFSGVAAGRLAVAGGQVYLLLATALSLAIIAITVALTPLPAVGGDKGGWEVGQRSEGKRRLKNGGLFSVLRSSVSLFQRSPLLAALLAEAMVCQVLTATLNMSFNEAIRESLVPRQGPGQGHASGEPGGAPGAGFVGKSFALIGLLSGVLQLLVLPWAMVRVNPSLLLRALPLVAGFGFTVTFIFPGFRTATAAFAVTKILEYSVRGTALELVYQPMADQERLLGKEAIATVGVRIGRTTAHIALYLCSALLGGAPPQRALMGVALGAAAAWAVTLRKVEELARARDKSRVPSPLPSPRLPPSKKHAAVDKAGLVAGSVGGADAEGKGGADQRLRRRDIRGEFNGDDLVANERHAAAAHFTNGRGNTLARKEL